MKMTYSCTYGRDDGVRVVHTLSVRHQPVGPALSCFKGSTCHVAALTRQTAMSTERQWSGRGRRQKPSRWWSPQDFAGIQQSLMTVGAANAASSALGQLGETLQQDSGSGGGGRRGPRGPGGGGGGGGSEGRSGPQGTDSEQLIEQVSGCAPTEDVVLLEVTGMHCTSCSGRVRRLLEAQPHVTSASVSLTTETALVRIGIPALPLTAGPSGQLMSSLACPAHYMSHIAIWSAVRCLKAIISC